MGSWGYEPRDGDSSHDMLSTFADQAEADLLGTFGLKAPAAKAKRPSRRVVRVRDAWDRWSRLGLVQILSEDWHVPIPLPVAKRCLADLEAVAQDVNFVSEWRDPKEFMTMARSCWGWLAGLLKRADAMKAEAKKTRGRGRDSKRHFVRRIRRAPTAIYGSIFGPATSRGQKDRIGKDVNKEVMPPELVFALRKTLKAALAKKAAETPIRLRRRVRRRQRARSAALTKVRQ